MNGRTAKVALLLFGSGTCALIYQTAWLRQMRLIFGASTAASAAVLAIFMGGLGLGGAVLGRRADRRPNPLAFYAQLELTVALSAAATPALVWLVRQLYVSLGGSVMLGTGVATLVRLLLATLVLCVPTLAMGGTLPAASRAIETEDDVGRRNLAILYGTNTLGAVTGALVSTFFMLEVYGTRMTLWLACLLNVLVAVTARSVARELPGAEPSPARAGALRKADAVAINDGEFSAPRTLVLAASAVVGFGFFLMELVWYRMLAPLLGGSSFTFGLILAVALLGIGLGGAAYALRSNSRPATLRAFALTCTLEAVCIAYPYALGDRIAYLALLLRPLGVLGFSGLLLGWAAIAALVIVPAAFVAGLQFPLLIGLLGRGEKDVGRDVGLAYAWNTVGAIAGALAGGFGLLPALSATGAWCAVVAVLLALGLGTMVVEVRARGRLQPIGVPFAVALVALLLINAVGPTAVWRHSAIGAGRALLPKATPNGLRYFINSRRRCVEWSVDGVESCVALDTGNSYAFIVNGKSDGNARLDADTQVMSGLLGAILHPHPTRALVIGLGTGSTAGWLGAVPSIERVDVVELEPAVIEIARVCADVNEHVLANPKVHLLIGDAREVLLTSRMQYDIIFSEPSNPYRAGVSSLFTREFYQGVTSRLAKGGIFVQWLQAYEIDSQTVRTAYATLASVFPVVETWQTHPTDLLLVGSMEPITYDVPSLRARVEQEPFRRALAVVWKTASLEGVLARFVARSSLARAFADLEGAYLNTDDQTLMEFALARTLGDTSVFNPDELRVLAMRRHEDRPEISGGAIDWDGVREELIASVAAEGGATTMGPTAPEAQRHRAEAEAHFAAGKLDAALTAWRAQSKEPVGPLQLLVVAEALARAGDDSALRYVEQLRAFEPVEAETLVGVLRWRQGRFEEATAALESALRQYQQDPWPMPPFMLRQLGVVVEVAKKDRSFGRRLYAVLKNPFSTKALNDERQVAAFRLASSLEGDECVEALQAMEPNVPWTGELLSARLACYQRTHQPQALVAEHDLGEYLAGLPPRLDRGLEIPTPAGQNGAVPQDAPPISP